MADDFNPTEWLTVAEASVLTGYSMQYVRRLTRQGRVKSRKWANTWMINRKGLLDYKRKMDGLGSSKHDPWRTGARHKADGAD
jgi:excisionase family DNA binding protein